MKDISLSDIFEKVLKEERDRENKNKKDWFTSLDRMKKEANKNGFKSFIGFVNYGKKGGCAVLGSQDDILCSIQNAVLAHREETDMWIKIVEVITDSLEKIVEEEDKNV